jgi:hypothetical protein
MNESPQKENDFKLPPIASQDQPYVVSNEYAPSYERPPSNYVQQAAGSPERQKNVAFDVAL